MVAISASEAAHNGISPRAPFRHDSLDHTTDAFRLIRVLPQRSEDGLLQLSLWHDSVSYASYRCLSYRWGDQAQCGIVLVNGEEFHVGRNLYHFLEEIHVSPHGSVLGSIQALWVDSICIDQSSVKERGHQVQHMGKIYENAKEVFVWLGKQRLSRALRDWAEADQWSECPEDLRDEWNDIRCNPYWNRAWIVQEILLARRVTVVMSGEKVDYARLGRAITRSVDLNRLEEDAAALLWVFWFSRWKEPPHVRKEPITLGWVRNLRDRDGFWDLIQMHKGSKCADERDRIYSLLGLILDGHRFEVDYNESAANLFWRVGKYFDAWQSPELVDILRIALFKDQSEDASVRAHKAPGINPWVLIDSLKKMPDLQVRIPVRRAVPTTSIFCRVTRRIRCDFKDCRRAPPLKCTHSDILLCTNAQSVGPTEHGCLHGLASPTDRPAAEPFLIKLEAHHGSTVARTTLPSTALQVYDGGINMWVGISTWSSLQKALAKENLDRADLVKLQVPAEYAIWIWFGIHPDHLERELIEHHPELPSAHHALPPGTKVMRGSIEVPSAPTSAKGKRASMRGFFDV
jgi:hypothetical protein